MTIQSLTNPITHKTHYYSSVNQKVNEKEKYSFTNGISTAFMSCKEKIANYGSSFFSIIMNFTQLAKTKREYVQNASQQSTDLSSAVDYINRSAIGDDQQTLKNFASYFDKYCAKEPNSVSFKQALKLANEGRELLQKIENSSAEKPKDDAEAQKQISQLGWFFTYNAAAQNKAFTSGTFCLKNTKVLDHFKNQLYKRKSSHFKGRCKTHYGLDVKRTSDQALPVDKRTVLMGAIDLQGQEEQGVYIKLEHSGCNLNLTSDSRARTLDSIMQSISHFFDFNPLERAKKKVGFEVKEDNKPKQKEHIPKALKKSFKELVRKDLSTSEVKYDKKKLEEYGIAYIKEFIAQHQEQISRKNSKALNEINITLDKYGSSTAYRKGDEVFIDTNLESKTLATIASQVANSG